MNIKEYRYILEIERFGGISKAAASLHISQPSLSVFLKKTEERIGASLFEMTPAGLRPTPVGQVYLEYAKQITGMDEKLMETLDGIRRQQTGVVRIGTTATRSVALAPIILSSCRTEHPGIEVKFQEHNSSTLEDMLVNQRSIDIILINESPLTSQLPSQLLSYEEILLAVPEPFAKNLQQRVDPDQQYPWVDLKQLKDVPFVLHKTGHRLRQISDRYFDEAGIYPEVLFETQNISTAVAIVQTGMAACFLYDSVLLSKQFSPGVKLFRTGSHSVRIPLIAAYTNESLRFPPIMAILDTVVRNVIAGYRRLEETSESEPQGSSHSTRE